MGLATLNVLIGDSVERTKDGRLVAPRSIMLMGILSSRRARCVLAVSETSEHQDSALCVENHTLSSKDI